VIVDYANVFASLEKALAIYGAGRGGVTGNRLREDNATGSARRGNSR